MRTGVLRVCRVLFACCLIAIACTGCASLRNSRQPKDDPASRQARKEEAVRQFNANREAAQFQSALSLWNQGDIGGFQRSLEELLKQNPDHPQAGLMLAELYFLHDQPGPAAALLERIVVREPANAQAQHLHGLVLERLGRPQDAAICFQRAAELDPKLFGGASDAGMQLACHAASSPTHPVTTHHSLPTRDVRHASFETPIADFKQHLPPPLRASLDQAEGALMHGAVPQARQILAEAIQSAPDRERAALAAAVLLLKHNQPACAVDLLKPAIVAHPQSAALHRTLGAAHYRAANYPAAELAMRQALSLDKASGLSYFLMGCTLARLGHADAAEAHYRQAAALDPAFARL